jgi:hypothetical protein
VAGILFVVAVVAETAVSLGVPINQKIARALADHRTTLLIVECLCVVYAATFPIYLWKLYDLLLRKDTDGAGALGSLLLVGGVLFVALHAVSDVGIYGLLVGKVALFGAHHDQGISYTLYLMTYALDSVADIFGSLFAFAAGVLVFRSGVLPRWLGWVSIIAAPLLFRASSRPHRICVAPSLRPDQQRRLAQEREIGWRRRSSRVEPMV